MAAVGNAALPWLAYRGRPWVLGLSPSLPHPQPEGERLSGGLLPQRGAPGGPWGGACLAELGELLL